MRSTLVMLLGAAGLLACQSAAPEDVGEVTLAIAAGPSDAACLRVIVTGATGATSVRTLALTPGATTAATLGGLPLGAATVKAEAFDVMCGSVTMASVANWVSDSVPVMLTAGMPVAVQLVMQPTGQIRISVDWNTTGTGNTGGGGASGGGGAGGLAQVAAGLNGQMLVGACLRDTEASVCATVAGACPDTNNADVALRGVKLTDKTITLGGTPGTPYTITVHVQGEVESKNYVGGADQNAMSMSPSMDGWRVGGTPSTANAYSVYMLRVRNPGSTTDTTYYLNSMDPPGVENHTTYGVDYVAQLSAQGGASIRIVAADANCSQIKNCGPTPSGSTCLEPLVPMNIELAVRAANPTFTFTSAYSGQWLGISVVNVTSP